MIHAKSTRFSFQLAFFRTNQNTNCWQERFKRRGDMRLVFRAPQLKQSTINNLVSTRLQLETNPMGHVQDPRIDCYPIGQKFLIHGSQATCFFSICLATYPMTFSCGVELWEVIPILIYGVMNPCQNNVMDYERYDKVSSQGWSFFVPAAVILKYVRTVHVAC